MDLSVGIQFLSFWLRFERSYKFLILLYMYIVVKGLIGLGMLLGLIKWNSRGLSLEMLLLRIWGLWRMLGNIYILIRSMGFNGTVFILGGARKSAWLAKIKLIILNLINYDSLYFCYLNFYFYATQKILLKEKIKLSIT